MAAAAADFVALAELARPALLATVALVMAHLHKVMRGARAIRGLLSPGIPGGVPITVVQAVAAAEELPPFQQLRLVAPVVGPQDIQSLNRLRRQVGLQQAQQAAPSQLIRAMLSAASAVVAVALALLPTAALAVLVKSPVEVAAAVLRP